MLSSVANSLRVLECLVHKGELGVSDIARELDLTVGTAYRLVSSLSEAGFAEQNGSNRKYGPGPKVLELANTIRSRADFIDQAHPELEALMQRCNETVNLGVLRAGQVVYVDRVVSNQPLVVEVRVGSRIPAYCTALGKVLLAFGDPEVRADYLAGLRDIEPAEGTRVPARSRFEKELAVVANSGHAADRGEFSPDIGCVAAPVLGSDGRALAAVSVSGPRTRIERTNAKLAKEVRRTADQLSTLAQRLGSARIT